MRRSVTKSSLSVTLRWDLDIQDESECALPNFGGERALSTTLQRTQEAQLSELLNILEKKIKILECRYLEDFATSRKDIEEVLVPLYDFTTDTDGIK